MFTTLRKFTVILLAILQLFAPLVHAHAGEKVSGLGLHVPGLEKYGAEHDASVFHAVSYDSSSDGIIVGIDAGMKDKQVNAASDLDSGLYLHQQAPEFNAAISPFDINFSPQTQPFICRLLIPSLSPRAPPAQ
ncbi:MAG: hypothetical protein ACXWT1_19805 [Methylobacter sp.]